MIHLPKPPAAPDGRSTAPVPLRFEDVTQDGRVLLEALPNGLGEAVWRGGLSRYPATAALRAQGVLPILTRLVLEGTDGPFAIEPAPVAEGRWQLAHTAGDDGAVHQIVLNIHVELTAPRGRTYPPAPDGAGEPLCAGRVFAEHVFTRPFAPPGARRVTRLEAPGVPEVPGPRYSPRTPDALLALPEGAVPLDTHLELDPVPLALGLGHTDSNQHVNSLVYPRLFEESALRRFVARGRGCAYVPRALEVAFRKPSFAGEVVFVALQGYAWGERLGAAGVVVSEEDARAGEFGRARTYLHMVFER